MQWKIFSMEKAKGLGLVTKEEKRRSMCVSEKCNAQPKVGPSPGGATPYKTL